MYKIFHHLQQEQQGHEEEKQDDCYSYSTITTNETDRLYPIPLGPPLDHPLDSPLEPKSLALVDGLILVRDGLLPLEIEVPDKAGGKHLANSGITQRVCNQKACIHPSLVSNFQENNDVLPDSLFVDDDEELNLVYQDEHQEDKDEEQPHLESHLESTRERSGSPKALFVDDDEELNLVYQDENQEDEEQPYLESTQETSGPPNALFVDDDEELNLVYQDENQEDEDDKQQPEDEEEPDLAPSREKTGLPKSLIVDEDEELHIIFDDESQAGEEQPDLVSITHHSDNNESASFTRLSMSDEKLSQQPDGLFIRFEEEGFTRFEI